MRSLLALLLMAGTAYAAPPATNAAYEFYDPAFGGDTVLCDEASQIAAIATAPDPNAVFKSFRDAKNARNEPICIAAVFQATVLSVTPIGVMHFNNQAFHSWDVEIVGSAGIKGHALYLEIFNETNI